MAGSEHRQQNESNRGGRPELGNRPISRLEQEASRISDPAERLRFLRSHAHRHSRPGSQEPTVLVHRMAEPVRPAWTRPKVLLSGGAAVALAVVAVFVAQMSSSAGVAPPSDSEADGQAATGRIPSALEAVAELGPPPAVWQVSSTKTTETYSNGLQIDTRFETTYQPREKYPIFALPADFPHEADPSGKTYVQQIGEAQEPRGIVYHTTESQMVPFTEASSANIDRLGKSLARLLKSEHAYHYLIDRYGRVFRIVKESNAAGHTGFSAWADSRGLYVNLNHSFLGVAFEAQSGEPRDVTAAQVTAARMLTEMLRYRYSIPEENCVTHAQVSINPYSMKLGNHTDWAYNFPFKALGLSDNYALAPAAIWALGFTYDEDLIGRSAGQKWPGLSAADTLFARYAADHKQTSAQYRLALRRRYKEIRRQLKKKGM